MTKILPGRVRIASGSELETGKMLGTTVSTRLTTAEADSLRE